MCSGIHSKEPLGVSVRGAVGDRIYVEPLKFPLNNVPDDFGKQWVVLEHPKQPGDFKILSTWSYPRLVSDQLHTYFQK